MSEKTTTAAAPAPASNARALPDIARHAAAHAQKCGAREVAALARQSRNVELTWRDGKVEKVAEATSRGLDLEVYVEGRYASMSTSDLRPDAVERFVESAVALSRALTADPFRALPEPALYRGRSDADLQLEDATHAALTMGDRTRYARAMEEAARSVPGSDAIVSVTTNASDTASESFRVHSNGFEGARRSTSFSVWADTTVRDSDGRRPESSDWFVARHRADLPDPAVVGRNATLRALARLGAKKGASAEMTVAVENRAAGRLVSNLLTPLSARALQQKASMYEGKLGQAIGSERLDLRDDPLIAKGLASQHFDGEGIAARALTLFESGVLRSYYVDNYYGKKLKLAPTTGRSTNLVWKAGARSLDELLADMKEGVLVTDFLGGNSNGTTGDFSLGIQGFMVRGGRKAEPVAEMNLSGNHLEFWKRLAAVGNDPFLCSAMRTPTLVFEGVQIAGT